MLQNILRGDCSDAVNARNERLHGVAQEVGENQPAEAEGKLCSVEVGHQLVADAGRRGARG